MQNLFSHFSDFSSRIKRINIEIPHYKYFHSPSKLNKNDKRFIGRTDIINKLKKILTETDLKSGAYLVTGYRGMGKSSYVNKVLNQITLYGGKLRPYFLIYCCLLFILYLILKSTSLSYILTFVIVILVGILYRKKEIISLGRYFSGAIWMIKNKRKIFPKLWQKFNENIRGKINNPRREIIGVINKRKRIPLKLNLGHDILDEKDILCLISKNIEKEFRKFAFSLRRQFVYYILRFAFIFFITIFITEFRTNDIEKNRTYSLLFPTQIRFLDNNESKSNREEILKTYKDIYNKGMIKSNFNLILKDHFIINNDKSVIVNFVFTFTKIVIATGVYCDMAYFYLSKESCHLVPNFISKRIPLHLNFFSIFVFILLNFLLTLLTQIFIKTPYTRITSRKFILKKLKILNEHIEALIKTQQVSNAGISETGVSWRVNHSKSKEQPLYNIRQIEKSLIDIFAEIDNLMFPILRPEFLIVFDELDKIDPKENTNIEQKKEETTDFDASINGITGGTATRFRKQNVIKLLANMKYFITTAKAKFIFIAGRELYDAFLADVSDRNFSISSIFHEVVYVESFLSDPSDGNKIDVSSMTEHYICSFLIPEWYITYSMLKNGERINQLTLKIYKDYLASTKNNEKREIQKAITFLYQFIHYLTHVSNGAPKKITNLFERYIVSSSKTDIESDLFIGKKRKNTYLSFGFYDQCQIGFIHYLAHPIMMAVTNNVSSYGDKLLVSASFLIDHIYKFHNNGFSWRNLEHVPEILDINHTPELRNFIGTIINYLIQVHITPIVSGLYLYKFPMKISEEISFISKMSEEASAIFNFSLDESLAVKQYYEKMLNRFTKQYRAGEFNKLEEGEFIHSIADIHHILGDLHLLDEEYSEAIFEYQYCTQFFSSHFLNKYDVHQGTHLLFILRTMLKLALVFEKRKTFNSAYMAYCELISMLIDFRYIDEKEFGLKYKIEKTHDWTRRKSVLFKSYMKDKQEDEEKNRLNSKSESLKNEEKFVLKAKPAYIEDETKANISYAVYGDKLLPGLADITTPLKNKMITKLSMFEDIRLMYQPLLAKLFVLEKHQMGGISVSDLTVTENEFLYLHLTTNIENKFLISADFFKKLGDIMFYKNGLISWKSSGLFQSLYFWDYDLSDSINYYCDKNRKNIQVKEILEEILMGISNLSELEKFIEENKNSKTVIFSEFIRTCLNNEQNGKNDAEIYEFLDKGGLESFDRTIDINILNKVERCIKRREELLNGKRRIAPCYACKYYNRSMEILSKYLLMNEEPEEKVSKAFIFLRALTYPQKFYSHRDNFTQTLAATIGGFGDILVSCSTEEDYLFPDFLECYFSFITYNNFDKLESIKRKVSVQENNKCNYEKYSKEIELSYFKDDESVKKYFIRQYFYKCLQHFEKNGNMGISTQIYQWVKAVTKNISKENKEESKTRKSPIDEKKIITYYKKNIPLQEEVEKLFQRKYKSTVKEIWHHGLSNIEKAFLYYLAAAKYYKRSSNLKESHAVYRKILQLLIRCAESKPVHKVWIKKHLKNGNIKREIVRRIIQCIFGAYEYIHSVEIQKIKWNETMELYELLELNQLSLFPDLEESIYAYYELEIICGNCTYKGIEKSEKDKKSQANVFFEKLYNLQSLSPYRLNSSIYNRLIALRFKVLLNRNILEEEFKGYKLGEDSYKEEHACIFYKILNENIENKNNRIILGKEIKNASEYLSFFEFLILDSIFCLQKFIEVLYPGNKTFLFTNSYVASVYKQFFEWSQLFDYLFIYYAYNDDNYPQVKQDQDKQEKIRKKLIDHCCRRYEAKNKNENIDNRKEEIKSKLVQSLKNNSKVELKNRTKFFFSRLENYISKTNTHLIDCNYLAEMAIKKIHNAFEMHQEGKAYKNVIMDMYYLNDDLDNDIFKFYLSLERYLINIGKLNKDINALKSVYNNSSLFKVDKYLS